MVEAGEADVVLAQYSDRVVREPYLRGYLNLRFAEHGVKLRALDDAEDGSEWADVINFLKGAQAKAERTKFVERTQRNKPYHAREGGLVSTPPHSYRKDGYRAVVVPEKMAVVRRMFSLVASEGTLGAAKSAFERESIAPPGRTSTGWRVTTIRSMILNDAYRPHAREELGALAERGQLARGVLESLDPDIPHGVLWYNRERIAKRAGKRVVLGPKPESEWVAVPLPDAGVSLEDALKARRAVARNVRSVSKGRYPYDLRGMLFCECGRRMDTRPAANRNGKDYFYYLCPRRGCEHRKYHNARELDERASRFVESLLRSNVLAEQLEAQIEAERKRLRDPSREIEEYLKQMGRIDKKLDYFLDLAAEEGWPKEALRAKLDSLREQRKAAQAEVERERSEHRRKVYRDLDLSAVVDRDGNLTVRWFGGVNSKTLSRAGRRRRRRQICRGRIR